MARVIFTASVAADSAAILSDLNAKAGHRVAATFRIRFGNVYDRLAGHPESGPPRPALGPNIRIGIFSPYVVIYRHIEADDEGLNTSTYKWCLGDHNRCSIRNYRPCKFIIFLLVSAWTHNDSLDRQSGAERLKQRDVHLGIA